MATDMPHDKCRPFWEIFTSFVDVVVVTVVLVVN